MARGIDFHYLHADHLGSVVSMTRLNGAAVGTQRYSGYGKTRSATQVLTVYQFQGQKQDAMGLQYFNARYFDPQTGTFISPDMLIPDPSDLYSYNRYMAFRGNPMKYTDPSGHWVNWAIGRGVGFAVGATMYAIGEHHRDGVDLSVDITWDGWVPTSVKFNEWGDLMAAGGSGAAAGLMIATPGMQVAGASMAGNLLTDHF